MRSNTGFALHSISADGLAHRYTRAAEPRPVVIDVLAPEGLGERADLTTSAGQIAYGVLHG